jgi:hypothetical protein
MSPAPTVDVGLDLRKDGSEGSTHYPSLIGQ